jgi:hypothetical protein
METTCRRGASKYDLNQMGHRGVGEGVNYYSLEEECQPGRELSEAQIVIGECLPQRRAI